MEHSAIYLCYMCMYLHISQKKTFYLPPIGPGTTTRYVILVQIVQMETFQKPRNEYYVRTLIHPDWEYAVHSLNSIIYPPIRIVVAFCWCRRCCCLPSHLAKFLFSFFKLSNLLLWLHVPFLFDPLVLPPGFLAKISKLAAARPRPDYRP